MSSNDIDYDNEITFDDGEELMFKMNDVNPDEIMINNEPNYAEEDPFNLQNLSKDELIEKLEKIKTDKRKYIRKYQKTAKGRAKTREASKKYYHQNREKVLARKKLLYQQRKALKNN